jgi:hypothetical protein
MALALALGAGMPLLWAWLTPAQRAAAVVADASAVQPADRTPAGRAPVAALPVPETAAVPAAPAAVAQPAPALAPQIPRVRDPNGDQSPDITDFINNGEVPTMAEVISRLRAAGVSGGLAAFNPPGTRPPLVGIAVSEDFELPPGYVRHHQFTDDGRRIEPILMFSPDHPLVAAAGPSVQPQDLVVPPAMVPPGLPIRSIVVPPPAEPGK